MNTNNSNNESRLLIQNQHFLNESSLAEYYIACEALAWISFVNCNFEDCKITNSDMTRAKFYDTHFKNFEFLSVDLAASDFDGCKLKSTRFFKSKKS